ncbi:hypothetical protein CTI12_AA448510 [Artemisia annua]|uniref:Catalase immune-responsive domain-containing protein n=1 Tax=Artemisia annua TaxID=35608 RepID=A0A2U1LRX3_ARTAN|nr:hypothetical protein CTI12_AA448510 [Artemisia annua]
MVSTVACEGGNSNHNFLMLMWFCLRHMLSLQSLPIFHPHIFGIGLAMSWLEKSWFADGWKSHGFDDLIELSAYASSMPSILLLPLSKMCDNRMAGSNKEICILRFHVIGFGRIGGMDMGENFAIERDNDFKQPGGTYKSFSPDRKERFITRIAGALSDPRVIHEVCTIWISYWSRFDSLSFLNIG